MCVDALNNIANAIHSIGETSFFDWLSLIISLGSLIFAILVPVRIAKTQNKISLFEKRLTVYNEFVKLINFSKHLNEIEKIDDSTIKNAPCVAKANMVTEGFSLIFKCEQSTCKTNYVTVINNNRKLVESIVFLHGKDIKRFSKNSKSEFEKVYESLTQIIKGCCCNNTYTQLEINNFNGYIKTYIEKYIDTMEKSLKL